MTLSAMSLSMLGISNVESSVDVSLELVSADELSVELPPEELVEELEVVSLDEDEVDVLELELLLEELLVELELVEDCSC